MNAVVQQSREARGLPVEQATTLVIRFRDPTTGKSWLDQHKIGETLTGIVSDLHGNSDRFILEAVLSLDFVSGTITDVTATALHSLASECDCDELEAPAGTHEAFERYGIALPVLTERRVEAAPGRTFEELGITAPYLGSVR